MLGIFLLRLSGETFHWYYFSCALIRLLARPRQRASFCVGKGHFGLSSAAKMLVWKGSNARSTCFWHQNNRNCIQRLLQGHPCIQFMACMQALRCSSVCLPVSTSLGIVLPRCFFPFYQMSTEHAEIATCLSPQPNLATQALRPHASEATTDTPSDASRQSLAPEGAVPHYRV